MDDVRIYSRVLSQTDVQTLYELGVPPGGVEAVGIGDSTPDGDLLLDVAGKIGATHYCDDSGSNCFTPASVATAAGANRAIQFNNSSALAGSSSFVYTSSGNVGIGIPNPGRQLNVHQLAGTAKGILLSGDEQYQTGNGDTNGVAIVLGVNRSGNRQLWIGDSTAIGSSTLGMFRYQTGTTIPGIDAVSGNGLTRLNVALATDTSNVLIGPPDGNTTAPGSALSVVRNLSIGSSYWSLAAPTDGALIQGTVGIGTSSPSYKLHVAGQVAGNGAYVNSSDVRWKREIIPLSKGLEMIEQLHPVEFRWIDQGMDAEQGPQIGLIAQDVEPIVPQVVSTADDDLGTKSIAYGQLTPLLIKGVQELKAQQDLLATRVADQTSPLILHASRAPAANLIELRSSDDDHPSENPLAVFSSSGHLAIGKPVPQAEIDVVGDIHITGQLVDVSDRRLKENISPLTDQLSKVLALQSVSFTMKGNGQTELGLIAQDVQPFYPELVTTSADGTYSLNYQVLIAPLIEAIQEQQRQIETLQRQNERFQQRLKELEGAASR